MFVFTIIFRIFCLLYAVKISLINQFVKFFKLDFMKPSCLPAAGRADRPVA
jgi:hypothetical protein